MELQLYCSGNAGQFGSRWACEWLVCSNSALWFGRDAVKSAVCYLNVQDVLVTGGYEPPSADAQEPERRPTCRDDT